MSGPPFPISRRPYSAAGSWVGSGAFVGLGSGVTFGAGVTLGFFVAGILVGFGFGVFLNVCPLFPFLSDLGGFPVACGFPDGETPAPPFTT